MDLTSPPRSDTSSSARLWFAFLGGMAAYAVHLVVGFWIVPAACGTAAEGLIPWLEGALTVLLGAVAIAATVVAVVMRRALARDTVARNDVDGAAGGESARAWDAAPAWSTARFMATTGIVLSGLGVVVIAFAAVPLLLVSPCA